MQRHITLQPKQSKVWRLLTEGRASWIGMPGGRGCGKSEGIDRLLLWLHGKFPGCTMAVVMRTFRQVREYHIDPFRRKYPELEPFYSATYYKYRIPNKGRESTEIVFMYADSYKDVENNFRSGNFKFILVDQAEQFLPEELMEIKKACRDESGAKMLLSHNMGGISIQFLKKIFYDRQYNERQKPEDYAYVHMFPWDNVHWVRQELEKDGLTEQDYYSWTDSERKAYAAERGEYTRALNSDDDAIRARDWESSWDAIEGAFFAKSFGRRETLISPADCARLIKPWHTRWMSGDWGRSHYSAVYWHARVTLTEQDCIEVLGWTKGRTVNACITYRELVVSGLESNELGQAIVQATPEGEREKITRFFLSPDAFGVKDSPQTIAIRIGLEVKPFGIPHPEPADNDRQGGAALMAELFRAAKTQASNSEEEIALISSACPEILNAIPAMQRDLKNLDDVVKTDKGMARIEQDTYDGYRYGIFSMLKAKMAVPATVRAAEISEKYADDESARHMKLDQFWAANKVVTKRRSAWRRY